MKLPEFSVERPVTITMLILIVVVVGAISLSNLGLDLMPDITYPVMSVVTSYEGVASEEMENLVTKPIEEVVATVKNVKKVKSFSQEALSVVMAEFEWGANLDLLAQDIRDRLDMISDFLPEDMDKPIVVKFDPSMMPVSAFGIVGKRDLRSLRQLTKDVFKDSLEQVDGVASAMVWGGREREVRVEVDRKKLESLGLSLGEVSRKLALENLNLPAGHLKSGYQEYLLRTVGEFESVDEIRDIVITLRGNVPIYLKDIATVSDTYRDVRSYARTNKRNSVLVVVNKESGANTVAVSNGVNRALKELKGKLPQDIKFYTVFDQSRMIKRILKVTGSNAILGGFLAVVILFLFLHNFRPTIAIALAIPLSLIATFIPLYFLGYTLNFITMIGIALGVGMIVDNGIVVIENTFRHLSLGEDSRISAKLGATEVSRAITTSTLTTVAVFLPLLFIKGIAGKLFTQMALTISFALVASLFVALTLVPMMASKIFKTGPAKGYEVSFGRRTFSYFRERYKGFLHKVLARRKRVVFWAIILFLVSLGLIPFMGKEFFPSIDNNMAFSMVKMPVGTNLEETDKVVGKIEDIILAEEGVQTVGTYIGLSEGTKQDAAFGWGATGVNEAEIFIRLEDKLKRKRISKEIVNDIRAQLPQIEGAKYEFMDMAQSMITGGGAREASIELKLFGKDLGILENVSRVIMGAIGKIEGVYDLASSLEKGRPELQIIIDRQRASQLGLTVSQIASTLQTAVQGKVATLFRQGGEEVNIRVSLDERGRGNLKEIENIILPSPLGVLVRLQDVADIREARGPIRLNRENQKRMVSLTANLGGRHLSKVIKDVKNKIRRVAFPEGYFVDYGGQAEKMRETFVSLSQILILAVLLVFMIMAAQFESFTQPLVIMFTVPLALIGVILAIVISGKTLSLPSGIGVVVLAGIIVNNGIVMIDYVNQLRKKGMEKMEAIIEGAGTRLRPILMTASTTILAILPLAINRAEGSAARSVVAVSIMGGLLVGSILTLIVIPALYSLFEK
ncbi:MAG: efflux RND transporter permease subunit [bacterium]